MKTAILVLTRSGLDLARRLREAQPDGTVIFGPSCVVGPCGARTVARTSLTFTTDEPGLRGWVGPLRKVFPTIWEDFDAIVAVMALGIVTRLAGPLVSDKRRDPAVVVVDDAGHFAISVLGGHEAGANDLARQVAYVLGALPVITTASEAQGVPAVGQIGRALGWTVEHSENLTRVAAAVVRRQRVAVWRDAGEADWWRPMGAWPEHFVSLDAWSDLDDLKPAALLVISDRALPDLNVLTDRTLVYRPPSLVAGIGCKRGTSRETIDAWANTVFNKHGLAAASLAAVATVTLKLDEPGLLAFAKARRVPLVAFPADQLADHPGIESPSERVRARVGIAAVAEPAALRAAGATKLVVPKQIGPGVTLAVARKP
ncbi:MAG: hypothetical protein NVSMB9_30090 [Isosphaeraceae bacterium]